VEDTFATALHETGHAIAFWLVGSIVRSVVIRTEAETADSPWIGGVNACSRLPDGWDGVDGSMDDVAHLRAFGIDCAVVCLAGAAAVAEVGLHDLDEYMEAQSGHESGDYHQMISKLGGFSRAVAQGIVTVAIERLWLLFGDPKVWTTALELARELDRRRKMPGGEVTRFLESKLGDPVALAIRLGIPPQPDRLDGR